jgi:predicted phosphodiesterase
MLISDRVYSNWQALQAVADHIERWQADRVVVAGDVINRGPRPVECADFVLNMQRERDWRLVLGNHEEYVLAHRTSAQGPVVQLPSPRFGTSRWTYDRLNGHISDVQAWPFQQSWQMSDGSEVRIVHASMRGTRDGVYRKTPDEVLRQQVAPAPKLFVVGHTHIPLVRVLDETLVVNVGSAGLPFDGDPRVCYAQLTWQADRWAAKIVRVEYDCERADRDFDETGFIDKIGPFARLIRAELAQARAILGDWSRDYETAVTSGEMSLDESVERVLAG